MPSSPHHQSQHPHQQRGSQGKRDRQGTRSSSQSTERADHVATPQRSPALQPSAVDDALSALQQQHHHDHTASSHSEWQTSRGTTAVVAVGDSPHAGRKARRSSSHGGSDAHGAEAATAPTAASPLSQEKGGKHKKARQEERAAAHSSSLSSCSTSSAVKKTAQSLLSSFSEIEIQFQLEQDRAQRTTLAPRDVANLILWSVPAPVPLIESPRIFFIKNKSRVRNVVVIYVNGWSYDELLCTGVGLPRLQTRPVAAKSEEEEKGGVATEDLSAHWDRQLCASMLSAVREGRCWARPGRGSGCAGGVQYCPLFIPSTRNELEKDLWWRNDAPRRPGGSSSSTSNSGASAAGLTSAGGVSATVAQRQPTRSDDGDALAVHHVTSPAAAAEGVGSLFKRALQVHTGDSKPSSSTAASASARDDAGDCRGGASGDGAATTFSAFQEYQHLWRDVALLRQYALKLPTHATALAELGFVLTAPPPAAASSDDEERPSNEKDQEEEREEGTDEESSDEAGKEAWTYFDDPAAAASVPAATAAGGEGGDGKPAVPPKVFALDCEMVQVAPGESALARATLVDVQTGQVVLDTLVKPQRPVTDYLTRFSGIDKAMLDPVTTTLADCQAQMKCFIDTQSFVVGHSLENDFKACKFVPNCYVLDTAWLFPHPAGLPYKNALRFLAQKYLNRRIQQGSHDSAIDALVSAELTQLKLLHGPTFGVRPRVSVLGLITAAAGDAPVAEDASLPSPPAPSPSSPQLHTATPATPGVVDVQVHLFDDATVLASLLPQAKDASTKVARIDAVPTRHDEDAMRKTVRALQRRGQRGGGEKPLGKSARTSTVASDGVTCAVERAGEEEEEKPSFGLYWVQLTQTKVDVVLPTAPSSPVTFTSATLTGKGEKDDEEKTTQTDDKPARTDRSGSGATSAAAAEAVKGAGGGPPSFPIVSDLTPEQYSAAQQQTVHDTNRRVLRVVEACPDETLVIVLTGRCTGESGGNHFSRAQGTCFAFVKDSTAPGPGEEELTKRAAAAAEVAGEKDGLTASGGVSSSETATSAVKAAVAKDTTPPVCQQQ